MNKAMNRSEGRADANEQARTSRTRRTATDRKANVERNPPTKSKRSTTGQGAAAGSAKLSTEQRSKITTIFKQHRVAPAHLNVSIRVGTRVPESVHFYPLPVEVYRDLSRVARL